MFDTSGVKIYEAGEWKKENYGRHRKWKKLHVAMEIADQHELYKKCERYNKCLLTPPRKDANGEAGCVARKEAIKIIRILGGDHEERKIGSRLTGYNQRAQIERLFSRWKRVLGESLKSKLEISCSHEIYIKSLIMNRMTKIEKTN